VAFTHTPDSKLLKVLDAHPSALPRPASAAPGTVLSLDGGAIHVACGDGVLALTLVVPEGKRPMGAADFIRGRKISVGDVLA
jgi:methionyl-tRNA formyltransferase